MVCGAHSESFAIEAAGRPTLLGVHFKPGGAVPFLKVPADELGVLRDQSDAYVCANVRERNHVPLAD